MRAVITEAVGAAFKSMQSQVSEQLLELQADVTLALDKLDGLEVDVRDMRIQVDQLDGKVTGLAIDMKDTRTQVAKLSREFMKDKLRDEATAKRLTEIERRLAVQEAR